MKKPQIVVALIAVGMGIAVFLIDSVRGKPLTVEQAVTFGLTVTTAILLYVSWRRRKHKDSTLH
jgi:uncharacterized membrane protein YadS